MTPTQENALNSKLQEVDASTLRQWIDQQAIALIDVRELGEYAGEHIPGATPVPLSSFNPDNVPRSDRKVVLYCQTSTRSAKAAQKLFAARFEEVSHLKGGLNAWKQSGYETQVNKNAPISIQRQVQIVAGSLVFLGTLMGAFVSPWFLLLSGFVGTGLIFAGVTNTCAMGMLLAKLPYNQQI